MPQNITTMEKQFLPFKNITGRWQFLAFVFTLIVSQSFE